MGSQPSYQRLSTSMEDAKEKTHQLSKRILDFYATWGKKHYCCAGVVLTLFVTMVLAWQVPRVHPEIDRKLQDENSELRKEISALKANISSLKTEMEAMGKEKGKLGEEGKALRSQVDTTKKALVDTTQHLEETRMDVKDLQGRLDAMNQTLSKTGKQLEESTRQDQMKADLELANGKLKEALSQRDSCNTQLEENIAQCNAESKNQQVVNEKLKEGKEELQRHLQNVLRDKSKCQDDLYQLQIQPKSDSQHVRFQDYIWIAVVAAIIISVIVSCCK